MPTELAIVEENSLFSKVSSLDELLKCQADPILEGAVFEVEPTTYDGPIPRGGASLVFAKNVYYLPRHGVIVTSGFQIFQSTGGQITGPKELKKITSLVRNASVSDVPSFPHASVWASKAAYHNFGHFLLDCLSALAWLAERGVLTEFPALAAPLKPWAKDVLDAANLSTIQTHHPIVRVENCVLLTTMDSYLQRSAGLIEPLKDAVAQAHRGDTKLLQIYISRRGLLGRIMTNEPALERGLLARGITILRPQMISIPEQLEIFRRCDLLIGASGAGLANSVFLPMGSSVFEIGNTEHHSSWIMFMLDGLGHHHLYSPGVSGAHSFAASLGSFFLQLPRKILGKYNFTYHVDLELFFYKLDDFLERRR